MYSHYKYDENHLTLLKCVQTECYKEELPNLLSKAGHIFWPHTVQIGWDLWGFGFSVLNCCILTKLNFTLLFQKGTHCMYAQWLYCKWKTARIQNVLSTCVGKCSDIKLKSKKNSSDTDVCLYGMKWIFRPNERVGKNEHALSHVVLK